VSEDGNAEKVALKQTAKARMLQRVATFRDLERAFLREREKIVFTETPYALFTAIEGRERWGIWRLLPNGPDLEEPWAEFDLLAATAIDAMGLPPLRHPTALDFDPTWSGEDEPAGLNAVHESTRAWLDFLRAEWGRRKREEFEFNTLKDIWAASAAQCKVLARDYRVAAYQDIDRPAGERPPFEQSELDETAIRLPGVLPDLPRTTAGDLQKTWLSLLDHYSLTDEHVHNREAERARFRQSATRLRDSSRAISGSWRVDDQFADTLVVADSCSLATAWFSSLAVAYWGLLSATWRHLFPTWTEKIECRVLLDVATIWGASDTDAANWFSIVCAPAVKATLRARVLDANSLPSINDPTKLQNRLRALNFRDPPKSEGQPYQTRPNPCYYFDRTEINGLMPSSRNAIVAGLLEIHSACLEGSHEKVVEGPPGSLPLKEAFDCFAKEFQKSAILTSQAIDAAIPKLVFDAHACGTWRAPVNLSPYESQSTPDQFGYEWTCQESLKMFDWLLESRKVFWRAQMARQTTERSIATGDSERSRFSNEAEPQQSDADRSPIEKEQMSASPARFPGRAIWLADRLQERSWSKHDVSRFGGPDQRTVQKILDGDSVRADVLGGLAQALSKKLPKVDLMDIPRN